MVLRVRKLPHGLAPKTGPLLCVLLVRFGAVPSNPGRWRRSLLRLQNVGVTPPLRLPAVDQGGVPGRLRNKDKIVGQKAPFKLKDIWALRVRLQMEGRVRELALFNLGIDSKLRGCDLVALKVRDVTHGDQVATRAIVMQHKTKRPVQFEITGVTREALQAWIKKAELKSDDFLFPSRLHESPHLGTRQYARILGHWVDELGLDRSEYGTHSMRRTKATLIYRRTKNLRAVQLLLGHSKLESTVRYLGIEVDDALEISEQTEI